MKTLNAAALAHIAKRVTSLAVCWRVTRRDGVLILGTEHDRDIPITLGEDPDLFDGVYRARAGITGSDINASDTLAVENSEVSGSLHEDLSIVDLRPADIEAGLFDGAAVVVFLVNWRAPNDFQIILGAGTLGDITRTAEGRYRTERRGLTQALVKNFIRTIGIDCDAIFGDERCGFPVHTVTFGAVVTAVTSARVFTAAIDPGFDETLAAYGVVAWTYGENEGFEMDVKGVAGGVVTLFMGMPLPITAGDTFTIQQGCDYKYSTCKDDYDNLLNFRGHGFYVPGQHEIMKIGGQETSGTS